MRKLIFLDFDGVLNSHDWFRKRPPSTMTRNRTRQEQEDRDICPDNIAQLNKLVAATGAEVVVSSTWRIGRTCETLRNILQRNGFMGTVTDKTPRLSREDLEPEVAYQKWVDSRIRQVQRGEEIQAWIDANCYQQDIAIVILDDDADMAHLAGHLVQTSLFKGGLCEQHVVAAIAKLGEKCEAHVTKD